VSAPVPLREYVRYFLRLGTLGFGGPIALCAAMQRDLVEERGWVTNEEYVEGLALAQLMPGPLAAQLAIYLGWVRARVLGATLTAAAFILPSFLMVLLLSAAYVRYQGLPWMQGAFYGIGAAVIAIVARSAFKLARSTLKRDPLLWGIFAVNLGVTAWTESEIVWIFVLSGVLAIVVRARPRFSRPTLIVPWAWWTTGLAGAATTTTIWRLGLYFAEAGAFVFGSGLAIVPFLHGGVVDRFHWLTERQFLDAVAVAMITPGPVVITVAFIGYLVAGPLGATASAIGVFLPCYLTVVIPAPYYRRFSGNPKVKAFVDGVSAAATGAIGGAAIVLGRRAIVDLPTVAFCLGTLLVLKLTRRVPEPIVILIAGAIGLAIRGAR
jgi:chromate transporter